MSLTTFGISHAEWMREPLWSLVNLGNRVTVEWGILLVTFFGLEGGDLVVSAYVAIAALCGREGGDLLPSTFVVQDRFWVWPGGESAEEGRPRFLDGVEVVPVTDFFGKFWLLLLDLCS